MSDEIDRPDLPKINGWFHKTGWISALVIMGLVTTGLIALNGMITPWQSSSIKIHAASTQAIRAQNISILATNLAAAKRPGRLYTYRTELAAELNEFEAVHRGLILGDSTRGLTGSMSVNVRLVLTDPVNGLDRFARDFIDQVRRDFLSDALSVEAGLANNLSDVIKLQLSPRLERLSDLLTQEASSSVYRVQATLLSFFGVILLSMLMLGRLVYRPLRQKVSTALTALRKSEIEMRFDEVTGLANRAYLLAFMADHCKFVQHHDLRSAVLAIEIQGADIVRDDLDRQDSDAMMAMIARRIESVCRTGDFVAKLGPDEFVVVLTSFEDDTTLNDLTKTLRTKLSLPVLVDDQSFTFKTKIGIKIATSRDRVPAAILNQAANALKIAKASDVYDIQFYSNNPASKESQREQEVNQIKEGLKDGAFVAHLQPIIDLKSDTTIGLEALVRWQHPKRGTLSPIHFMETAINNGLAGEITRAVLGDVLKALKAWQGEDISVPYVSINLDLQQLEDQSFVDELKWILDSHEMPASKIAFEFSESAFLAQDRPKIKENIKRLADHGFRLVLDDYGTLGLHLSKIGTIKLEHVKLDRAFVVNIDSETQQQRTTRTLVQQAKSSRMKIVAAGVETPGERSTLTRMEIDAVQGYLICEPISVDQIKDWLAEASSGQSTSGNALKSA